MKSCDLLLQEMCSAVKELYKLYNLTESELFSEVKSALDEADEELENEN